ncbi:MAG: hybrid sensor histidine kinase/response regulator [Candidatus Omnitrophota bacterium]|nr:hybrid sensor histidine kinase/response regulator [Candidatus Omnitrophota bacterium]
MAKREIKILHIDDSPIDREIMAEALKAIEDFEIKIESARTATEGLEKAAGVKDRFDVIIVDYKMPGLTGVDFMRKLKEKNIDIPVIMSTGAGSEKVAVEVMKLGAYDYMLKDEAFRGGTSLVVKRTLQRYEEKKERERLEAETKEYDRKLKKANEELRKVSQMKSDFVSIVSHELRTPLSSIREGVSQVLDGVTGEINNKQRKYLAISIEEIDRLNKIVNDLLNISRLEAGKVELNKESIGISGLVNKVIDGFKHLIKDKDISLTSIVPQNDIKISLDAEKIRQVVLNLIFNAYKFTKEKGKITVEVKNKEDKVEIVVKDTGIGIAREDIPRLFSKFAQFGQKGVYRGKGTGLGLVICKSFIEMHGGKIWAESELNKGSKFIFSLPKKPGV